MIIGEALRKVFEGMTVTYTYEGSPITDTVQFHHGSQKELNKWIALMNSGNYNKFPLIWYVRDTYTEFEGVRDVPARLILFQITKPEWLNDERTAETYIKVLDPLLLKVKDRLEQNPFISVYSNDIRKKYDVLDEPNYGVNSQNKNDFNSTSSQGTQQITIDPVDAKVIDFFMRIKTDCILNK